MPAKKPNKDRVARRIALHLHRAEIAMSGQLAVGVQLYPMGTPFLFAPHLIYRTASGITVAGMMISDQKDSRFPAKQIAFALSLARSLFVTDRSFVADPSFKLPDDRTITDVIIHLGEQPARTDRKCAVPIFH